MITKLTLTALLLLCINQAIVAQTTEPEKKIRTQAVDSIQGWRKGGIAALGLSQTSLTNWSAGGQNSFSLNGLLSVFANYKKDKSVWSNTLDIGYGVLQQGKNAKLQKTDDKIDLLSKYGRQVYHNWYYAVLLNFKTQMAPGFNYPNDTVKISDLFAPAYLLGGLGADYKPDNYFSLFVAPVTLKLTIVNDQALANAGAFGVEKATFDMAGNLIKKGMKSRSEFGGYLRMVYSKNDFKSEFMKNIAFTTKLDLFSDYQNNPQNIDISWETLLLLKVNKYISLNVSTNLLYDDDIDIAMDTNNDGITDKSGPRTQFKEILGVGFSYKF